MELLLMALGHNLRKMVSKGWVNCFVEIEVG